MCTEVVVCQRICILPQAIFDFGILRAIQCAREYNYRDNYGRGEK